MTTSPPNKQPSKNDMSNKSVTSLDSNNHNSNGLVVDINNPDKQVVDVVGRHLVQPENILNNVSNNNNNNSHISPSVSFRSGVSDADYSLQLPSGDITRDLYKWQQQHASPSFPANNMPINHHNNPDILDGISPGSPKFRRRSMSIGALSELDDMRHNFSNGNNTTYNSIIDNANEDEDRNSNTDINHDNGMSINDIRAPGGFRRNFILQKHKKRNRKPNFLTNNFIEFLTLYGHFAGEDLSEDENEEDEEENADNYDEYALNEQDDLESQNSNTASRFRNSTARLQSNTSILEDIKRLRANSKTKLLKNHDNNYVPYQYANVRGADTVHSHTATSAVASKKASHFKTVLLLLKSFVGTGVLFLPKGFQNGGYLFSTGCLLFCSVISYYCFVSLISARKYISNSTNKRHPLGYGELGGAYFGQHFQTAILQSIILSQLGFASAYIVFTATNLQQFFTKVFGRELSLSFYIFVQSVIFIPFSLTRSISKLGGTALIADAFILLGLIYVFYYCSYYLVVEQHGISSTIVPFNNVDWSLFIGTAIFTYEGIGLLIPIQDSMKNPHKFPKTLFWVMVVITIIFISCGLLCYGSFGDKVETVILLNFPQDSVMTQLTQFLYAMAILLSTPLQLFPAIRILENHYLFPKKSGKHNKKIKWLKNEFRTFIVLLSCLIAWIGANDLDKFVSLVGSLACIPLIYIYPPLMHSKAFPKYKLLDYFIVIFGFTVLCYTTTQTILLWVK
ncbi:related to Vacuolar amino acid transporter 3 [Saccharomycodes ludwigii]|uniref:Related to Vacuolar amino acid transporter 3 n=1 Tax=Saccharomycodes ludwigii TaxID=36035 RepID=A0A376BB68_9ASCO|nr:hypothetical protein SCDLUD_004774 [Saccharomycodes ludwigii]KAH3899335.1 hypothetical protein SCDLUD_004774 [Saccharomycodes ludwigii]SSD61922.1 related to Vacuolar amino acid transporter 3 [Saccharomycodes ludwigii]